MFSTLPQPLRWDGNAYFSREHIVTNDWIRCIYRRWILYFPTHSSPLLFLHLTCVPERPAHRKLTASRSRFRLQASWRSIRTNSWRSCGACCWVHSGTLVAFHKNSWMRKQKKPGKRRWVTFAFELFFAIEVWQVRIILFLFCIFRKPRGEYFQKLANVGSSKQRWDAQFLFMLLACSYVFWCWRQFCTKHAVIVFILKWSSLCPAECWSGGREEKSCRSSS